MNKIIKKIEIKKLVVDRFEEVPRYVTKDGKEFEVEELAIKHEERIILQEKEAKSLQEFRDRYKYRTVELDDRTYDALYLPEITDLVKRDIYKYYDTSTDLQPGWMLFYIDSSGDHDYTCKYSLGSMIREREEDLVKLRGLL